MLTLSGRVVRHVGEYAVVQVEGGLLPLRDAHRTLVPGDGASVVVTPLDEAAHCGALDACAAFSVAQDGPVALLSSPCGGHPVALLLSRSWPSAVLVRASTPAPEVSEGAEPNDSASAPDPDHPAPRIFR